MQTASLLICVVAFIGRVLSLYPEGLVLGGLKEQCFGAECLRSHLVASNFDQAAGNNGTNSSTPMPPWQSCMSTPTNSYANITFEPYPIQSGQTVSMKTNVYLDDDVVPGTYFLVETWKYRLRLFRGPWKKIDICDYVAAHFPNATQVRCPINQWAMRLVMYAINQFSTSDLISPFVFPNLIWGKGLYTVRVKLIAGPRVLTCAINYIEVQ